MTKIQLDFVRPTDASVTAKGYVRFTPTGVSVPVGLASVMVQLDTDVRFPQVREVELLPTGKGWAWNISVHPVGGIPFGATYVVPDTDKTVNFRDLVRVDPVSLDPNAEVDPAWWAMAGNTVTSGRVDQNDFHLYLTDLDGDTHDAGYVRGPEGKVGPRGKTPKISAVAVKGENAAVSVTGTDEAPAFRFTLPKGDKGDAGPEGRYVSSGSVTGGELTLGLSDGSSVLVDGNITGPEGRYVKSASVTDGVLTLTRTDDTQIVVSGSVKGDQGPAGQVTFGVLDASIPATRVSNAIAGDVTTSQNFTQVVAPFAMRIESIRCVSDYMTQAVDATNHVAIVARKSVNGTTTNMGTWFDTNTTAITARVPFNLNVSVEAARTLAAGDMINFAVSVAGTAKLLLPLTITVQYTKL